MKMSINRIFYNVNDRVMRWKVTIKASINRIFYNVNVLVIEYSFNKAFVLIEYFIM